MSIPFWRKLLAGNDTSVPVSRDNPLPVQVVKSDDDENDPIEVQIKNVASPVPIGHQSGLTVDNTTAGIALTVPSGTTGALVTVVTAPIRFWVDGGTVPTATTGHRADVNDDVDLQTGVEVRQFRAIREGSTSATLEVTYYG